METNLKNSDFFGEADDPKPPKPLLSRKRESSLSKRQVKALDQLERLIQEGVPDLTMSEIASRLKVSLRTLYELAPSKDQLLLIAVDRILFRIGGEAKKAIKNINSPLEQLKVYVNETGKAMDPACLAFTRDFGELKGARVLVDSHENYVVSMTKKLLERSIQKKLIKPIDISAFAMILSGLGREIYTNNLKSSLVKSPEEIYHEISEIIFLGLEKAEP